MRRSATADERAGDVERPRAVDTGHLGGLASEQRASGRSARCRHPAHHGGDELGVEGVGGDVVEEEQRSGVLHEHVVDAVVDDVDADSFDPPESGGQLDLRADAVGRRNEHRLVQLGQRRCAEHAAEAADTLQHTSAGGDVVGRLDRSAHLVDRSGALVDVDPGGGVGDESGARGAPADVPAYLHPLEADLRQPGVGRGPRRRQVVAQAGDRQHPAAARALGAIGIEPDRSVEADARRRRCGRWGLGAPAVTDTGSGAVVGDRDIAGRRRRIPGRCGDDRDRCAGPDAQLVAGELAAGRRQRQRCEVGLEEGQHRLGLGIAEADVVLDQSWPVRSQHQTGVEHTDVGRAGGAEVVEYRLDEGRSELVSRLWHRRRGIGAHAAGVRAGVALADALVVLGER